MSLDVKLTRPDGKALGAIESVQQAIRAVLPDVRFYQDAGGQEKINQFEARGIELPEALRNVFAKMPAIFKGDYGREQDGLWLHFVLGAGGDLRLLHVSVKSDTDAAERLLNDLAASQGWTLSEYSPSDEEV
jgi:hypothetical protein